jgi:hypothetical protein
VSAGNLHQAREHPGEQFFRGARKLHPRVGDERCLGGRNPRPWGNHSESLRKRLDFIVSQVKETAPGKVANLGAKFSGDCRSRGRGASTGPAGPCT